MTETTVHNTDCLEYMRTLPDNYFQLAIADPPYGIGAAKMTMGSGKNKKMEKEGLGQISTKKGVFYRTNEGVQTSNHLGWKLLRFASYWQLDCVG